MRARPISLLSTLLVVWLPNLAAAPAGAQGLSVRENYGGDGFRLAAPGGESEGEQAEGGEEEVGIHDNSFLVEEAYNQEAGIVQHIFNFVPAWDSDRGLRTRTFDFVFTQEWPVFSQRHQFSYTVPMLSARETFRGETFEAQGFGDVLLNYRYQLLGGSGKDLAVAPRFSVILPTGDEDEGLSTARAGYQVNLPLSKEFDRWVFHANAGLTVVPGVTLGVNPEIPFEGRSLNGYNLGFSAIHFLRPNLHLMLETVALWDEELDPFGIEDHRFEWLVSPGFRWAPYTEGETQWVVGLGVPIGLTRDAPDIAAFFYMSFEHRFVRRR